MSSRNDAGRLLRSVEEAWAIFQLSTDNRIDSREDRVKMGWRVYEMHGAPFGDSPQAINIWFHFRQRTTPN